MGPLATLFSTIDSAKRKFSGLLNNPGGTFEQLMGQMQDYRRQDQQLGDQAYGDPRKGEPLIKDKEAFAQLGQRAFDNVMSFAPAGITVWHGSPHKFDKFDASKIGKGEGAQAYGHGLYFAEHKNVADEYAGKLSKKMVSIDGFGGTNIEKSILDRLSARANSTQYGGGAQAALDDLNSIARFGNQEEKAVANSMLNKIGPFGLPSVHDAGYLYKVDLPDEHIAKMLDWDKPLSQQAPEVQRFFSDVSRPPGADTPIGEWIKPRFAEGAAPYWSADMRKAGIPGIRYLDGGSRGVGQGTSNFVVFPGNEGLLTILERNGQPLK